MPQAVGNKKDKKNANAELAAQFTVPAQPVEPSASTPVKHVEAKPSDHLADSKTSSFTLTQRDRTILVRFQTLMNKDAGRSFGRSTALKVAVRLAERYINDTNSINPIIDEVASEDGRLKLNKKAS